MQNDLYRRALAFREQNTKVIDDYAQFKQELEEPGGFFWAHWSGEREAEDRLQEETKATIRCIPFEGFKEQGKCLITGKPSSQRVLIAKAYRLVCATSTVKNDTEPMDGGVVKKSLFVTVLMTILCGVLWILFLAATHQAAVPEIDTPTHASAPAIAVQR
jgi:hypothetical protein